MRYDITLLKYHDSAIVDPSQYHVAIHRMEVLERGGYSGAQDTAERISIGSSLQEGEGSPYDPQTTSTRDSTNSALQEGEKVLDIAVVARTSSPILCFTSCKNRFMSSLGLGRNPELSDVCTKLANASSVRDFWALYCCDMTFCGLQLDVMGPKGKDRKSSQGGRSPDKTNSEFSWR
jgi:hypothetical protein